MLTRSPYAILLEGREHSYTIRHSRRARRILLQVHPVRGIELVLPRAASLSQAQRFLQSKQDWLQRVLGRSTVSQMPSPLVDGTQLPLLGGYVTLRIVNTLRPRRAQPTSIPHEVPVAAGAPSAVRQKVYRWYRQQARAYFEAVSHTMAGELGTAVRTVTIRDQSTRWGSCSSRGTLSYNWRLMLAPAQVARYVVAHEVVHLLHRHHQPAFWHAVERLHPTYKSDRAWLRRYGNSLRMLPTLHQ